jgi:hypothetical protein
LVLRRYRQPVQFVWVGDRRRRQTQRLIDDEWYAVQFVGPSPIRAAMLAADVSAPRGHFRWFAWKRPVPVYRHFAKAGGMPDFVAPDCGAVVPYLNVAAWPVKPFRSSRMTQTRVRAVSEKKVRRQFDVSGPRFLVLEALCADVGKNQNHEHQSPSSFPL